MKFLYMECTIPLFIYEEAPLVAWWHHLRGKCLVKRSDEVKSRERNEYNLYAKQSYFLGVVLVDP